MKKLHLSLLTLLSALFILASCNKDEGLVYDPEAQFQAEKPIIENYVKSNYPAMQYSSDTTGLWFEIIEPGIAGSYEYKLVDTIIGNSQGKIVRPPLITVRYTGKLLTSNTPFDSNTTEAGFTSNLSQLIAAWQIAFQPKSIGAISIGGLTPKGLQKGSKIRFVTPSYYAYGSRAQGSIPANSPLYFEIEVLDIK